MHFITVWGHAVYHIFGSMLSITISFNADRPFFSCMMYFQSFAACSFPLIFIRSVYTFFVSVSLPAVYHSFNQCSVYFVSVYDNEAYFSCMQSVAIIFLVIFICVVLCTFFPYFLALVSFYATFSYHCPFACSLTIDLFYSVYPLCGTTQPIHPALNANYRWI